MRLKNLRHLLKLCDITYIFITIFSKIFEISFLENGILRIWSEALNVKIFRNFKLATCETPNPDSLGVKYISRGQISFTWKLITFIMNNLIKISNKNCPNLRICNQASTGLTKSVFVNKRNLPLNRSRCIVIDFFVFFMKLLWKIFFSKRNQNKNLWGRSNTTIRRHSTNIVKDLICIAQIFFYHSSLICFFWRVRIIQ